MNQPIQILPTSEEGKLAFDALLRLDLSRASTQLCIAAQAKLEPRPRFALVATTPQLDDSLRQIVVKAFEKKRHQEARGVFDFHVYDPSPQQRSFEVEYQELNDAPDVQAYIQQLQSPITLPDFHKADESFNEALHAYIHVLQISGQEPIYIFQNYTVKGILHSGGFTAIFNGDIYTKLETPALQFDETIDCIVWGSHIFVLNKAGFHKIFREGEHVRHAGKLALKEIRALSVIDNIDEFSVDAEHHIHKLAKLRNMRDKGYLTAAHLTDFTKLQSIIVEYNVPVEIIVVNGCKKLRHNKKNKWALFKLLDDDYVLSPLTGTKYEANSKRQR